MPQIDELLGVATVAAAAMFAAIVVQPVMSGPPGAADAPVVTPVATAAAQPAATPIVRLPSVEVVARRTAAVARVQRGEQVAPQHRT